MCVREVSDMHFHTHAEKVTRAVFFSLIFLVPSPSSSSFLFTFVTESIRKEVFTESVFISIVYIVYILNIDLIDRSPT